MKKPILIVALAIALSACASSPEQRQVAQTRCIVVGDCGSQATGTSFTNQSQAFWFGYTSGKSYVSPVVVK